MEVEWTVCLNLMVSHHIKTLSELIHTCLYGFMLDCLYVKMGLFLTIFATTFFMHSSTFICWSRILLALELRGNANSPS